MKIVNEAVLNKYRVRGACEWCKRPTPEGCHPHHIFARGIGGGSRLDIDENLIALCWQCHNVVHMGKIPRRALTALVAARMGQTPEAIEETIYGVLRRAKPIYRRLQDGDENGRAPEGGGG